MTSQLALLHSSIVGNDFVRPLGARSSCMSCLGQQAAAAEWSRKFARALWAQVEAAHLLH